MKKKIFQQLKPFKVPLIILVIFIVLMIILGLVVPSVLTKIADSSPIVSISATIDTVYNSGNEIDLSDFEITASHENGLPSRLSPDDVTIDRTSLNPTGETTTVTLTLVANPTLQCNVDVHVARDVVVSFQCGYPDVSNVTAVVYSNGELSFEGEGDVLVFGEGECPWLDYEGMDDYPITAVSFADGVAPTNMNYWFENMDTLTYIDTLPSPVKTAVRTFYGCTGLTSMADWSECNGLLNISEMYSGCTSLAETVPLISSIRSASRTFYGCINLLSSPESGNAMNLTNASEMYSGCSILVNAQVGQAVQNMTGMFTNCINLKSMPQLPDTAIDLTNAFAGCISLTSLTSIPAGVQSMDGTFGNCEMITGQLTVNCDASSFNGMFSGAALATQVNLMGNSQLLDAYANTNDSGNIYVNGAASDPEITSYSDVFSEYSSALIPVEPYEAAGSDEQESSDTESESEDAAEDTGEVSTEDPASESETSQEGTENTEQTETANADES